MLITQTLLITLITLLARCHTMFGTSLINRPIVLGMLTGWIMGDLTQGIIIGGALELAFVGAVSIGAYIPPDMISGTILGTAFAIKAGAGAETALALGYPIATLMLAINSLGTPIGLYLMHKCDKYAEKGDSKKFERMYWITGFASKILFLPIVPLAFYFGSDAVTAALNHIPALGFAMLAQMIMNQRVAVFFFMGFFVVQYFGISTTGCAIFAVILAIVLVQIEAKTEKKQVQQEVELDDF